jgi:hypothetical protein
MKPMSPNEVDDAIVAVEGLMLLFKDAGIQIESPGDLVDAVDSLMGELMSAALFLSSPHFSRSPDSLRRIGETVALNKDVPKPVVDGFESMAKRVENTRLAQQIYGNHLLTQMVK